jgi:NAD(P)-dependent dehydrogenase (short-subunit alcohol dehydrogenase family)
MSLRFDGKVAVITGAGGGLGKAYAIALAQRGAKVVVNDLGGSHSGSGASTRAADVVVEELRAMGAAAEANYNSVEDGDKIIETAIQAFGRVDILINNAGILRDVSFAKMTQNDWDLINTVHLKGVYKCTKAAWPHMIQHGFGRIVNVTSAAGVYGNFGQVNYSTAKSGIMGFTKSCALEGVRKNVLSNCICPLAQSRMTETVLPKDMLNFLKPGAIVPVVLFMCHESSDANGEIIEAGGGWHAKIRVERAKGTYIPGEFSVEDVQQHWERIGDFTETQHPTLIAQSLMAALDAAKASKL